MRCYPCAIPDAGRGKAIDTARRCLAAVGFTHGLFNMEFFYDADADRLTVIEFNPRMAAQFSYLYLRANARPSGNWPAICWPERHDRRPASADFQRGAPCPRTKLTTNMITVSGSTKPSITPENAGNWACCWAASTR